MPEFGLQSRCRRDSILRRALLLCPPRLSSTELRNCKLKGTKDVRNSVPSAQNVQRQGPGRGLALQRAQCTSLPSQHTFL